MEMTKQQNETNNHRTQIGVHQHKIGQFPSQPDETEKPNQSPLPLNQA